VRGIHHRLKLKEDWYCGVFKYVLGARLNYPPVSTPSISLYGTEFTLRTKLKGPLLPEVSKTSLRSLVKTSDWFAISLQYALVTHFFKRQYVSKFELLNCPQSDRSSMIDGLSFITI
jgi:hypothetical protein